MYVYMYACMYVCMHACICVYESTYLHTCRFSMSSGRVTARVNMGLNATDEGNMFDGDEDGEEDDAEETVDDEEFVGDVSAGPREMSETETPGPRGPGVGVRRAGMVREVVTPVPAKGTVAGKDAAAVVALSTASDGVHLLFQRRYRTFRSAIVIE
jgi:hypothetical protein